MTTTTSKSTSWPAPHQSRCATPPPSTTIDDAANPDRGDREGYGFFVDEFRRPAPIRVAAEPDPVLHAAYDTTPGQAA